MYSPLHGYFLSLMEALNLAFLVFLEVNCTVYHSRFNEKMSPPNYLSARDHPIIRNAT